MGSWCIKVWRREYKGQYDMNTGLLENAPSVEKSLSKSRDSISLLMILKKIYSKG